MTWKRPSTLCFNDEAWERFQSLKDHHFEALFIVSHVDVVQGAGEGYQGESFPGLTVRVELDESPKCPRCWNHSEHIGADGHHNQLCDRCAAVVGE